MALRKIPNQPSRLFSRRCALGRLGAGFGSLALADLVSKESARAELGTSSHHPARARSVIFLYMTGGPSQIDTFDPKPKLRQVEGQHPSYKTDIHVYKGLGYRPSSFRFRRCGNSGTEVSELFPHFRRVVDDVCVVRSMTTDIPNHEPGNYLMNSGAMLPNRPSMGAWVSYGLGSANHNLPGFVVLSPGLPTCGRRLWSNVFLPAAHQGTYVNTDHMRLDEMVGDIRNPLLSRPEQKRQLELARRLNTLSVGTGPPERVFDDQIKTMELAFRMQFAAAEAFDIGQETQSVRDAYGSTDFAHTCLLARRLAERGVRFIQVYYTQSQEGTLIGESLNQPWDTHTENDRKLRNLAADSDRPVTALIEDLKQRGMLDETLVVWGGEFGRTPFAQKQDNAKRASLAFGRDHHHRAFTMWLAGGGVRGGLNYGATDELGMSVVENEVHVHDLHATILHLLGVDHTRLTYRYGGRDFRLTDVYGNVVDDILS